MIKTLGIISGVICIIILFLNFLLYFLQDIYFKTNNKNIKKSINSALPILSKYNKRSIFICFIFFLIHISCFFNSIKHFNLNALILFFLILIITFDFDIFFKSEKYLLKKNRILFNNIFSNFSYYFINN